MILHDMMPQGVPVEQVGVLASSVGFDATAQGNREVEDNANSEASTEEVTLTVSMVEEEEGGEASAPRWQPQN